MDSLEVYRFERMTEHRAREIAERWRYWPPFDFYDADADTEDLAELLDPAEWPEVFEACLAGDALVGFFSASVSGSVAEIGLGLRPDLTGQGRGRRFVEAVLGRLKELRPDLAAVTLGVAAFNERAIRTYKACGFTVVGEHLQRTNGSEFPFIDMRLDGDLASME